MNGNYTELKECLACGSQYLTETLDLGDQPLANSYTKSKEDFLEVFPLKINRCANCYHVQLSAAVNPDLMFKDYLYVSGTSKTMLEYFDWFASFTKEYYSFIGNKFGNLSVLDIGSNDGSMLDKFKNIGFDTTGIDPAENLYPESSKRHNIICDYFNENSLDKLSTYDIITAQNVFAHNYDPLTFLNNVKNVMHYDSLVFIQTSQANMILNNEYDTIYHEHISFYNIKSMQELCKRAGLFLIDVVKSHIHGISYTFIISKQDIRPNNIYNLIKVEELQKLYSDDTYDNYGNNCRNSKDKIFKIVEKYRTDGYKIIGYGAAAKGNTLLNFTKIKLDYVIDDNPLKCNHFTPGSKIEIVSKDILDLYSENDKILFIPLAWNFFKEIKNNIKNKRDNNNDKFLMYFPDVAIFE